MCLLLFARDVRRNAVTKLFDCWMIGLTRLNCKLSLQAKTQYDRSTRMLYIARQSPCNGIIILRRTMNVSDNNYTNSVGMCRFIAASRKLYIDCLPVTESNSGKDEFTLPSLVQRMRQQLFLIKKVMINDGSYPKLYRSCYFWSCT